MSLELSSNDLQFMVEKSSFNIDDFIMAPLDEENSFAVCMSLLSVLLLDDTSGVTKSRSDLDDTIAFESKKTIAQNFSIIAVDSVDESKTLDLDIIAESERSELGKSSYTPSAKPF